MPITNEMVETAYLVAERVFAGELTRSEGKEKISTATGMKIGSANDYVTVFLDMMAGKEYHRTINSYATRYYLENIKIDFGVEAFNKAIEAAHKHTQYYRALGRGNLTGIEQMIKELRDKL